MPRESVQLRPKGYGLGGIVRPVTVGGHGQQPSLYRPVRSALHLLELEAVELERRRLGVVPVHDRGQLALAVQAARALAEQFAGGGFESQSVSPIL